MRVRIVLSDLSNAFDLFNCRLLLAKLEAFATSPVVQRWMASFLNNRFIRVQIEEICFLLERPVCIRVPQTFLPSPVLLLTYVNGLAASI